MTIDLKSFISKKESEKFAMDTGRAMHSKLQFVKLGEHPTGDPEIIEKIMNSCDELKSFFCETSKTEVPIAGFIKGQFVSRRIDRMVIDDKNKTIQVLDYKTDLDKNTFREKYIAQVHEYVQLLKMIYPDYTITCALLWVHTWELELI